MAVVGIRPCSIAPNVSFLRGGNKFVKPGMGIGEHKELWFRGEGEKHERSILRPALYRPPKGDGAMKEIAQLLDIESELYEEFQRCGAQLLAEKMQMED
jgi:hypothetical protein